MRSGIGFSAGCNVGMTDNRVERITSLQRVEQSRERDVLRILIVAAVVSLELYADGKIIASLSPPPAGSPCVPGARLARDELDDGTIAPDKKVCRNPLVSDAGEIFVCRWIQPVGEKLGNRIAGECSGGQADGVHHDEA